MEFPKTMYLHPVDKTKEAKTLTVDTPDEQAKAEEKGYTAESFVKEYPAEEGYEGEAVSKEAIQKEVADDNNPNPGPTSEERHEADEAKGDESAPGLQQGVEPGELPATATGDAFTGRKKSAKAV